MNRRQGETYCGDLRGDTGAEERTRRGCHVVEEENQVALERSKLSSSFRVAKFSCRRYFFARNTPIFLALINETLMAASPRQEYDQHFRTKRGFFFSISEKKISPNQSDLNFKIFQGLEKEQLYFNLQNETRALIINIST